MPKKEKLMTKELIKAAWIYEKKMLNALNTRLKSKIDHQMEWNSFTLIYLTRKQFQAFHWYLLNLGQENSFVSFSLSCCSGNYFLLKKYGVNCLFRRQKRTFLNSWCTKLCNRPLLCQEFHFLTGCFTLLFSHIKFDF